MGIDVNKVHIPINFELEDSAQDSRFKKVKIWIAHTGENLNNTYFTKEVLEDMAKTLPHTPITGFLEKNEDNEDDFSDHRMSLVIEKNKVKLEYQGHAYGFISDKPNSKFEYRNGKEWLTCEGYLWTKFKKALEIFEKGSGIKSQSMEIEQVDGEVDEFGRMVFSTGTFSALCILGDHVPPAMTGSTAEFYSATKDSIREMLYEFSLMKGDSYVTLEDTEKKNKKKSAEDEQQDVSEVKDLKEGEESVEDVIETTETEETTEEKVDEQAVEEVVLEEESTEGIETESEEVIEEEVVEEVEESVEEEASDDSGTEEFSENKFAQFELSHESLRSELRKIGNSLFRKEKDDYYISVYVSNVYDEKVIYEIYDWSEEDEETSKKFYEVKYSKEDSVISLGDVVEIFPMFVTESEKSKIESDRAKLVQLEKEIAELQEYKSKLEFKEKEAVLDKFQEKLTEEEYSAIREQFSKLSVLEIEKEVAYTCFKKSSNTEEFSGVRSVELGATEASGAYGPLSTYFKKKK